MRAGAAPGLRVDMVHLEEASGPARSACEVVSFQDCPAQFGGYDGAGSLKAAYQARGFVEPNIWVAYARADHANVVLPALWFRPEQPLSLKVMPESRHYATLQTR